jgi:Carbamoyl-phosphate synthetase large chain, oligomerisation domain
LGLKVSGWLEPRRPPCRLQHRGDFQPAKIDRWFLVQIKEIVDFEEELAEAKN